MIETLASGAQTFLLCSLYANNRK